ncbi:purine catabolism regulatory protein, partial [Streptomyces sp. SolWspMP-sol7th]
MAAAEAESLPLLEVPRRTPFLAITKAVSAAIAAEQYRAVTAGFAAQRELTRQALVGEGPEGLIGALAAQLNGLGRRLRRVGRRCRRRARVGRATCRAP